MKMKYFFFSILFLLLSGGSVRAQLTCTNCLVTSSLLTPLGSTICDAPAVAGGVSESPAGITVAPLLPGPPIIFTMVSAGQYVLRGQITGLSGAILEADPVSAAGAYGTSAVLILGGTASNSYNGDITINSGTLVPEKSPNGTVAVTRKIIYNGAPTAVYGGVTSSGNPYNNQFVPTTSLIDFGAVNRDTKFNLFSSSQSILGLSGANTSAVVRYSGPSLENPRPSGYFFTTVDAPGTLTISPVPSTAAYTYNGVILNGSSASPQAQAAAVAGGGQYINIVMNGSGTQILKGNNTYTGHTTVSNGTLQLDGTGSIGAYTAPTATYSTGNLTISGAATTFINNSSGIQEFAASADGSYGDIKGTGIYAHSGSGKTIITGAKTFTGTVRVTNGFLGGAGDISKATAVEITGPGSIGGGAGVAATGGVYTGSTLKVQNLRLFNSLPKLVVTSQDAAGSPGVVDVYAAGSTISGSGRVTLPSGNFIVDLLDANLTAAAPVLLIKATAGLSGGFTTASPTPLIGINNTGKTPCLAWVAGGLQMILKEYTISLTATQLCRANDGTNPVFSATYSNHQTVDAAFLAGVSWSATTGAYAAGYSSSTWTTTDDTPATPSTAPTIVAGTNGFYNGTWTVYYNYRDPVNVCTETSSIVITVKDVPATPTATSPVNYCQYDNAVPLTATSNGTIPNGATRRLMWLSPEGTTATTTVTPDTQVTGAFNYMVYDEVTYPADNAQETPQSVCPSSKRTVTVNVTTGTFATLTTSTVCPKGTNAGNPSVVITATYPTAAAKPTYNYVWEFMGSSVRKANPAPVQNNTASTTTATYTFDGDNSGTSDLSYVVRFSQAATGCPIVLSTRINRQPVLQLSTSAPLPNTSSICVGGSTKLSGTNGNIPLGYWSSGTAIATVTPASGQSSAPFDGIVTGVSAGTVNIFCKDTDGCNSEPFALTVLATPILNDFTDLVKCVGDIQAPWIPASNGTPANNTIPDRFKWSLAASTPNNAVGLADYTTDWSKTAIDGFTAVNAGTTALTRTITVWGQNSTTTCTASKNLNIVVNPAPSISATSTTLCSNETVSDLITITGATGGTWGVYSDASAATTASPQVLTLANGSVATTANVTAATVAAVTTRYVVKFGTGASATCKSNILAFTINPAPLLSISGGGSAILCLGEYADIVTVAGDNSGVWAVYNEGTSTAASPAVITAANGTAGKGSLSVAAVTSVIRRDVVKYGSNSCKSNILTFTVNPAPLMNDIADLELCANTIHTAITPTSTGIGVTAPTNFQWQVLPAATHLDNVGLPDYVTDWSKTAVDGFTASNPALAVPAKTQLVRDVTVTPRNSTTGCTGLPQTFTITVNTGLTLTVENTSPICNGTATNILLRSNLDNTTYTWTVSAPATVTGQSLSGGTTNPLIAQTLNSISATSETVTYSVSATSGTCQTAAPYPVDVVVSKDTPAAPVVTGDGHFCAAPGDATYITNLVPSVPGYNGTVEWTYTSVLRAGTAAGTITGNTQKADKGPLTTVPDHLVISGAISGWIDYKFRPYTTCLGSESSIVGVMIHVAPVANTPANSAVCSGTATNIGLSSPTDAAVKYTWQVDKSGGSTVSGETTPSEAGANVNPSHTQPTASTTGPIADVLSIPANTSAQSIDYRVKPWLAGCPGTEVRTTVTVNPLPTVTAPADISVCSGGAAAANTITLTGANSPTTFKWSGGTEVGLADQNTFVTSLTNFTAATTTSAITRTVSIWGRNTNGCISAAAATFNITVQATPILDNFTLAKCVGDSQAPWTPALSGTAANNSIPDRFKWSLAASTPNNDVGLADYTTDWSKTAIDGFTAANNTAASLTRTITVLGQNAATTCTVSKNINIVVNPAPFISATKSALCSSETVSDLITIAGETGGTWGVYSDALATTTASPQVLTFAAGSMATKANVTAATVAAVVTRYVIKFGTSSTTCKSNILSFTVNPMPTVTAADPTTLCSGGTVGLTGSGTPATPRAWTVTPANGRFRGQGSSTTFTGTNTGTTTVVAEVTYTSTGTCPGKMSITINPAPLLSISAGGSTNLCNGEYVDLITVGGDDSGIWAVYNKGTTTAASPAVITAANGTTGKGSLSVAAVTAVTQRDVVKYGSNNCKSSAITFTVNPLPLMNDIADLNLCTNSSQAAITPGSIGIGVTSPTNFQWQLLPTATHTDDVGLPDYVTDWYKTAIDDFTANDPASNNPSKAQLVRDVTVTPRNNITGCTGLSQTFTITVVNTGLTLTVENTSPICNGTPTNILLHSSLANTTYEWTVSAPAAITGQSPSNGTTTQPLIAQTVSSTSTTSEKVTYSISASSGNCQTANPYSVEVEVSKDTPATPVVTGGGHFCAAPENGTYITNLVPSVPNYSGTVEWTYTSAPRAGTVAGTIGGYTQKADKGPLTVVTDHLVINGAVASDWVDYKFRPYTTCLGNESSIIGVMIHVAPVAHTPANSTICSGTATNIGLSSSTDVTVKYTWTVVKPSGSAISGETEPSEAGAAVNGSPPHQQPTASTLGPIANVLSIPSTVSAQTIDYRVKPWLAGCPGTEVRTTVTVNPPPAVTAPADISVCSGVLVPANALTGTNSPTTFKWSGGAEVGLADQTTFITGLPEFTTVAAAPSITTKTVSVWGRNSRGCISAAATFKITVQTTPTVVFDPAAHPKVCAGSTIAAAGSTNIGFSTSIADVKYTWSADYTPTTGAKSAVEISKDNTTLVAFPTSSTTGEDGPLVKKLVASAGSEGTITVTITPRAGTCQGAARSMDVPVVGRASNITFTVDNKKPIVCSETMTEIAVGAASDGNTYNWTTGRSGNVTGNLSGNGSSSTTIANGLTVLDKKQGWASYYITARSADCVGAAYGVTVTVDPVPVLTVTPATAQTICSGIATAITLTNDLGTAESADVSYTWTVADNTIGATASTSSQTTFAQQVLSHTANADATATYVFTPWYRPAGHPGCAGLAVSLPYTVLGRLKAGEITGVADRKICLGDAATLKANAQEGGGALTYQWWKDGVKIDGATGSDYPVPTLVEYDASYTVLVSNACQPAITSPAFLLGVTVDAYFVNGGAVAVAAPSTLNAGERVQFTYSGPDAIYSWDFGDKTFISTLMSPVHIYSKEGTFNPWLKVIRPGNIACTKTFMIPLITVQGVEYNLPTGDPNSTAGYTVFPIPAKDQVNIHSEGHLKSLTVSDLSGKSLFSTEAAGYKTTLDIGNLSPGIYILTIVDSHGVKRVKIIKD